MNAGLNLHDGCALQFTSLSLLTSFVFSTPFSPLLSFTSSLYCCLFSFFPVIALSSLLLFPLFYCFCIISTSPRLSYFLVLFFVLTSLLFLPVSPLLPSSFPFISFPLFLSFHIFFSASFSLLSSVFTLLILFFP